MTKVSSVPSLDSQQALALSIARDVQQGLPAPDSEAEIAASVEAALLEESRRNEALLAYLRAALLGVVVLLSLAAWVFPAWAGTDSYPLLAVAVALLGWALALALALALRRGWYRPWLRRGAPALDAAIIIAAFAVFHGSIGAAYPGVTSGFLGVVATACVFLALSGALRLSRSAAELATGLALATWAGIAFLEGMHLVPALLIAVLVIAAGGLGAGVMRVIRRVITNQVARIRLAGMYNDAQAAIDAREQVLGLVAHDLRNPLETIKMAAELLLEEPLEPEEQARYLNHICRAGERMNRMIHDLLDVARIEAGRLGIEPTQVEVSRLLSEAVEAMAPLASERSLTLDVVAPPRLPPVMVDPERIARVFSNLIGNAIKFTPVGGWITLRAERLGEKVRIWVIDTGPGIPPEKLSQIFGRFWQAQTTDRRGIGLGLSIAKGIIEAHRERIGVESRPGDGTQFWFTLPVAPDAD